MLDPDDVASVFVVEWYDPAAALIRRYMMSYYDKDNSLEMYDPKNHRMFLKRCKVENVRPGDLFIGNSINVLSRQLKIVDYGDNVTQRRLETKTEKTFALIKPDAFCKAGHIIDAIYKCGLQITKLKSFLLSKDDVSIFYDDMKSSSNYNAMMAHLASGPCLAIEVMGDMATRRWWELMGPEDPVRARECAPTTVRARFGTDCIRNAVYGSDTPACIARDLEFFFPSQGNSSLQNSACYSDSTCAVVKPHIVLEGRAGEVIMKIIECGFEVSAYAMYSIEKANAEEFFEVYKGVVQEYPSMVMELCAGPCIAMEVRAQDAQCTFREFSGPADPEIARHLRPRTIRALFGRTKTQNAIHCTDLPEDAVLEVEYFFKILDR